MRFYYWINNVEKSIFEGKKLLVILATDVKFEKKYILALSNLAMAYKNNNIEESLNLQKKAKNIIKSKQKGEWLDLNVLVLTNLATIYKYNKDLDKAIACEEQAFELLSKQPSNQSTIYLSTYLRVIGNLANSYMKKNGKDNLAKVLTLMEKANIINQLYANDKNYWIEHYIEIVQILSAVFLELKYNKEALDTLIELEKEVELHYNKNKNRLNKEYISILNNIVACCNKDIADDLQIAINYESKTVTVLNKMDLIKEQYWVDILTERLISLGELFFINKSFQNSIDTYTMILEKYHSNVISKEKVHKILKNIKNHMRTVNYVKSEDIYLFANYIAYTRGNSYGVITLRDTLDTLGFFELNDKAKKVFKNIFKDLEILNNLKSYDTNEELIEYINSLPMLKCNDQALNFINVFKTQMDGKSLGTLKSIHL